MIHVLMNNMFKPPNTSVAESVMDASFLKSEIQKSQNHSMMGSTNGSMNASVSDQIEVDECKQRVRIFVILC